MAKQVIQENGEVATSNSTLELSSNFKEIFENINVASTVKTQNGIITIYTDNLILNNNEYPISATFTNANGVEQELFSITNSNTEFGLTYDGEKLVWDVNIWNSLEDKTHITDERFTIKFYVRNVD